MSKLHITKRFRRLIKVADYLNKNPKVTQEEFADRRNFLRTAFYTTVSAGLVSNLLPACKHLVLKQVQSNVKPVVILGGGIAGLTAAYYLTKEGVPCEIYEASARAGGRMFTREQFNNEGMTCELGGELVDSNHLDLIELCGKFGIHVDNFAPGDVGLESEMFYFGGKHYKDSDLIPMFRPFAERLAKDQKIAFPNCDNGGENYTPEAIRLDHISLDQYLGQYTDVDKWILDMLRMAWKGEMGRESSEQPAFFMVSTLASDTTSGFKLYGDSDESKKIRGGNKVLIDAVKSYLEENNVVLNFSSPLVGIREESSGLKMTFLTQGSSKEVSADRVICTIPFSVLRGVEGVLKLPLNPLKKECIQNLGYGTNTKFMMGYKERIWRKSEPLSNGMVYSDLSVENVWDSSRTQVGKSGIMSSFTGGKAATRVNWKKLDHFLSDVDRIFPGSKKLYDGHFSYWDWARYPVNLGSYSSPLMGQTTRFGKIPYQPELSGKLLFAGEHATDQFGGFMNGACHSGKEAARVILNEMQHQLSS